MADSFYYRDVGADLRTTKEEVVESGSVKVQVVDIPDYVKGIMCEPALLEGEDPNLYWKMFGALIDERKPKTMSDWIALNDLATKLWEERLFRRASTALIRGGKLAALQQILNEIAPGETKLKKKDDDAAHRANRYFSDNKEERNEIRSLLAKFGITDAELHARSAQNNSDALIMFERLIGSRERSRRKHRKEDRSFTREQDGNRKEE